MVNIHPDIKVKALKKRYERICNRIEQLNEEAFEIEKELQFLEQR